MPGVPSKRPRADFHLENLTKEDIKKAAGVYNGGNLSNLYNIAIEYYLELRKKGDKGLEKFIRDRAES